MTQETALIILAAAVGLGLVILAVTVGSVARAIRRSTAVIEDFKTSYQTGLDERGRAEVERLGIERKKLELDSKLARPRILLLKTANLKLFEEKQELTVGYNVENLGAGKVLVTKLQVALVNKRTPNLIKILDVVFNKVVEENRPYVGEVIVSVKDFTRVSLPFVPDFSFIKDSCEIVASLEFEDRFGEVGRLDKDILEW